MTKLESCYTSQRRLTDLLPFLTAGASLGTRWTSFTSGEPGGGRRVTGATTTGRTSALLPSHAWDVPGSGVGQQASHRCETNGGTTINSRWVSDGLNSFLGRRCTERETNDGKINTASAWLTENRSADVEFSVGYYRKLRVNCISFRNHYAVVVVEAVVE